MKEQLEIVQTAINNLLATLHNLQNVEIIEGIKPKFMPLQKVWIINKNLVPSWYKMPVLGKSLEEGFEEVEIKFICIGKGSDLSYDNCGVSENKDKICVAYRHSWYNDRNTEENKVWVTLEEAMKFNKKEYNKEMENYRQEQKKKRDEEKKRLQEKIKKLS